MSSSPHFRTVDALAQRLAQAGCTHVFGMPGGEVLSLVEALSAQGISFVLAKHENAAGFMAEGMHHRTGAPALLVATVGPGALNCVNVVANALQDRVPMLVLTGAIDADEAQRYTHQVLHQPAVFAEITKASFTLTPGAAHQIIDKAMTIATSGQPGPVHIDIPVSVADAPAPSTPRLSRSPDQPMAPAPGPALEAARAALAQAKRPLIIAGVDAVNQGAGPVLARLVQDHGIPLITTYKAKGLVSEDLEIVLGGAGLSPKADAVLLPLVAKADCIIGAGYDPIEMRPGWRDAFAQTPDVPMIDLTAAPNTHFMHQGTLNFVGDVAAGLDAIFQDMSPRALWPGDTLAQTRAALARAFPSDETWGPAAIIDQCQQSLPRDVLASADSGAHRILLSQMWRCVEPRQLVQSSGLCTMGCAVPLAMGMSLAAPERTVVSFSGDAGFLMVAGELSTAAELGLRTIFVVFVDASLALIELKQRQRQMRNDAVDFGSHDYAAIGRAMGGAGHRVTSRAELAQALEAAQRAETFTVIAAEFEREAYDGRI